MSAQEIIYTLTLLYVLFGLVMLLRVERAYAVRTAVLDRPDWDSIYWSLPDYNAMVYRPRYWKLWTLDQWLKWVRRTSSAHGVSASDLSASDEGKI